MYRRFSLPIHVVLAIAIVFSQWAGMAHAVTHQEALHPSALQFGASGEIKPGQADSHTHEQHSHILHDCLLFDGVATSVALPAWGELGPAHTPQCSFAPPRAGVSNGHSNNPIHRVRARGPPQFS